MKKIYAKLSEKSRVFNEKLKVKLNRLTPATRLNIVLLGMLFFLLSSAIILTKAILGQESLLPEPGQIQPVEIAFPKGDTVVHSTDSTIYQHH